MEQLVHKRWPFTIRKGECSEDLEDDIWYYEFAPEGYEPMRGRIAGRDMTITKATRVIDAWLIGVANRCSPEGSWT
jgi:hypothetical protein